MKRERTAGLLLIAGALAMVLVMSLHPVAHDMLGADGGHAMQIGVIVHALALAALPVLILGQLGLARRLGPGDAVNGALVAYGFACVAGMGAAVASGFVATDVIREIRDSSDVQHALLGYTGLLNQGFAKVHVVAACASMLLWSAAILREGRMTRAVGAVGTLIGLAILVALFSGRLRLDVHGFGLVAFSQSAWFVWVGVLLCGAGPVRANVAPEHPGTRSRDGT